MRKTYDLKIEDLQGNEFNFTWEDQENHDEEIRDILYFIENSKWLNNETKEKSQHLFIEILDEFFYSTPTIYRDENFFEMSNDVLSNKEFRVKFLNKMEQRNFNFLGESCCFIVNKYIAKLDKIFWFKDAIDLISEWHYDFCNLRPFEIKSLIPNI